MAFGYVEKCFGDSKWLQILLLESVYLPQAQSALRKNKLFYR